MKSDTCRFLQRSALAIAIAGISAPASAAFFALAEQSASGMGTAFAGGAAIAEDASTVWYNPAGMTRLTRPQLVVAGHYIDPSFTPTVISASSVLGSPISGGAGKDPGESAVVPNLYYTHPITGDFSVGLGINAPFGLTTEYDSTWAGRYHTTKSDIKAINYNVGAGYKFNDVWSGGAGVSYQQFKAELSQAVDFATICTLAGAGGGCGYTAPGVVGGPYNPNTNPLDGNAKVTADSNAWGYNLGLLAQLPNDFRVGVAYRSKIKQNLSGNFDITTPVTGFAPVNGAIGAVANGLSLVNSGAKADVTLPASLSVSFYQQAGAWAFMADITKTMWSELPELRIKFDSGQADSVVTLNLQNSYRYSLGATYQLNQAWILRGGVAIDQSPVTNSADRTPRLPDADRQWLAIGAGLKASSSLSFDFGYAYITMDKAEVRKTASAVPPNENISRGNLSVDYNGKIQVFSAQARWMF
jgi:long-chain fatty acid transport protein